ncbi:hypothetical protein LLG95_12960 [bacterium]|nr:hypothetical protein [bacterium]
MIHPITQADDLRQRDYRPPDHQLPPLCDAEIQAMQPGVCIAIVIILMAGCAIVDSIARTIMPSDLEAKIRDGYVERGWTPEAWALRLRTLADRCEATHPDTAVDYRRWADSVERRHPKVAIEEPVVIPDEPVMTPPTPPPPPAKPATVRY